MLCFTSVSERVAPVSVASVVQDAGGTGLIIAKNPSDAFSPCFDNFPCVEVDYEVGTQILFYFRSSRYIKFIINFCIFFSFQLVLQLMFLNWNYRSPMVELSPSRTLVGKPLLPKVAFFSSRGPSSIAPAILKVYSFYFSTDFALMSYSKYSFQICYH